MMICTKCRIEMKYSGDRHAVYRRPEPLYPGDIVYQGEQYDCPECKVSFVITSAESSKVPGMFARLTDEAENAKLFGWKAVFPLELRAKEEK